MSIAIDQNQLTARVFHGLKSLLTAGDTLPPRFLEYSICEAFGLDHVGDGNFYADGVKDNIQVSVKTRKLNPDVLKIKDGRDFQSHPNKFLGAKQNKKHNKWTAGEEFIQRRQEIDNETTSSDRRIGLLTLRNFRKNIYESYKRYNTDTSYEIIVIHGYNARHTRYLVSVFWQQYHTPRTKDITWSKEKGNVVGHMIIDGVPQKVISRVRGGASKEATCFKEYKNPTKYKYSVSIEVPIPEPWNFDQEKILTEINNLKGSTDVPPELFIVE
jgi:hypothetical protein